jgi:hypothetical protein
MNKEQIIDEVYENYSKEYEKDNSIGLTLLVQRIDGKSVYRKPDKQMFIDLCTYDKTFSEKWGLKIEERELSLEERREIFEETPVGRFKDISWHNMSNEETIEYLENVPTKLITITYKDTIIESYE